MCILQLIGHFFSQHKRFCSSCQTVFSLEVLTITTIMDEKIVKRWKTIVGKAVFYQQMFLIEWCLAKTYPGFRWFNYLWGLRLDMPTPTKIRKHVYKTKRLPTPDF